MSNTLLTFTALMALVFFSFSIWASVEKTGFRHIISYSGEKSIYILPGGEAIQFPHSTNAKISEPLKQQLRFADEKVKGEV